MYYEVHGEGEPLVLVHWFFGSGRNWSPFIPKFKDDFQLIIPDLRGHGKTTNPSKIFTHRQAAFDVYALLDHLNIDKVKGMGCSSGGYILTHMATIYPNRVEAMVLDSATPYYPGQCRRAMAEFTLTRDRIERYRQRHPYGDEQIDLLVQQFREMKDSYDDVNFTKPLLSTIKAKTLIIHGDRDHYYPVEMATMLYESIQDSYLWIVPNTDHGVMLSEHLEEVKKKAFDFLTGKWEDS
jgi:pimeloyl-ACP methyl ester carboxylesterase